MFPLIYNRTTLLVGEEMMAKFARTRVIIFGVGGVGSWCAEGLVRSGVTHLTLVDSDCVGVTNINRQAMATVHTVGQVKVEALRERLLSINPDADIEALQEVYIEETADRFALDTYDYIVDAIDSLKDKASLILRGTRTKATFFSAMGAALKIDPTQVKVGEFWKVRGCPLGAAIRKKFRKQNLAPGKKFLCVYDEEVLPNKGRQEDADNEGRTAKAVINGTTAPITAIFGFTLAGLILRDLYKA